MSEKVEGELKCFSPILIGEYIRQMTAAHYINNPEATSADFAISPDTYKEFETFSLKAAIIGLSLSYDAEKQILSVVPDKRFVEQFENKIMRDMALKFSVDYANRYTSFIKFEA